MTKMKSFRLSLWTAQMLEELAKYTSWQTQTDIVEYAIRNRYEAIFGTIKAEDLIRLEREWLSKNESSKTDPDVS